MLVSLTVGKVDAGVAVLLTEDKRLIEFPSILLPPSITSGSIVDITVSQNEAAEQKSHAAFESLQSQILNAYGLRTPATPVLRLRNATQTSIVLEWDPIQLATSTLRSLALYRNGNKAGNIPRPLSMSSTKISGLQPELDYSFYLVLRTSGGTYTSNTLDVKTHSMQNLTGITVTPGVLPPQLRESLEVAVERIGAKIVDSIRIDTTHFVCTEGRGADWEKANENNIPVVRPEWIEGCEREGKIIGVRGYYLDANPKHRQIGSNPSLPANQVVQPSPSIMSPASEAAVRASQADLPIRSEARSPDPESPVSGEPGPEVPPSPPAKPLKPTAEDDDEESNDEEEEEEQGEAAEKRTESRDDADIDDAVEEDEEDEEPSREKISQQGLNQRPEGGGGEMEEVAL